MYKPKRFTINFLSHFDKNGFHYNQTVNITEKDFDLLNDILRTEKNTPSIKSKNLSKLFLFKTLEQKKSIVFLNHTQRDFFNTYLKLNLKDRNTCFNIF